MDRRTLLLSITAAVVVAAVALGGWAVVHARQGSSGSEPIALASPSLSPPGSPSAQPTNGAGSPSPGPTQTEAGAPGHWLVAMLKRRIPVYDKPRAGARIRMYLPARTDDGQVARVCLVRRTYESGGRAWYNVYLGIRPSESRGWISEKGISVYPVYTRIVVDTGDRTLSVLDAKAQRLRRFPVAVGAPQWPTPTGRFFVTEKIAISPPSPAYGVMAMAVSAFSTDPQIQRLFAGGQVAIHGTSATWSIGKPVSHGCVRLANRDIRELSQLVKTGSPVTIQR